MVIKYKKAIGLAEIPQSIRLRFSICERNGNEVEELITPCVCRDFLSDVILSSRIGNKFSIYGMTWDGSRSIPMDKPRFTLHFPDEATRKNFEKNLKFVHQIETNNKIELTSYTHVENNVSYIEGAAEWLNFSALSYSLYTLLLRIICYPIKTEDWITEIGNGSYSDSKYIKSFDRDTLCAILSDLSILNMSEWCGLSYKDHGVSSVHHNSGIVSVCSYHSEISENMVRKNTHYSILKEKGFKLYIK